MTFKRPRPPILTRLNDCAAGTLPAVSFVDPSFTLLLNTANSHPESDIRNGDAFMAEVYHAVATSPNWNSTVLILTKDLAAASRARLRRIPLPAGTGCSGARLAGL